MRADGYPWLYYQIADLPNEGELQHGSYSDDDFGALVSQCLWMYQGVFSWYDEKRNDIVNLPHAFCKFHEGMILTNGCTGREYEVVKVIGQFRDDKYVAPPIANTPESIKLPPKRWISRYHPDELTGGTVQIRPVDGKDEIDLNWDKGHFLSLPASNRPNCRIIYSEIASEAEGKGEEDRNAAARSGYEIEIVLTLNGPNQSREHFGDVKQPKPRAYTGSRNHLAPQDPTLVEGIWSQTLDTFIEFNLKAPSATETGWMAQWFQIFMWRYSAVLERIGFTQVNYDARFGGKIAPLKTPEAGDMTRLRYVVRWERILPTRVVKLRRTTLKVDAVRSDGTPAEELNPDLER